MVTKKTIDVFVCGKCGKMYVNEQAAENCCKQYYCSVCGKPVPKYFTKCDECREKEIFEKAKKYTKEEYERLFPDNMVCLGDDEFFDSVDEAIECCEEEERNAPEYLYGTTLIEAKVDADRALTDAEEEADIEDAYFPDKARKEFFDFVNAWNKENSYYGYAKDSGTIIVLSKELIDQVSASRNQQVGTVEGGNG